MWSIHARNRKNARRLRVVLAELVQGKEVVCTTQTDASFTKTQWYGQQGHAPYRCADGYGDIQATQITAGTSELRDITKMERIGQSHIACRTLGHPLKYSYSIQVRTRTFAASVSTTDSNHAETLKAWSAKPKPAKRLV